MNHGGVAKSVRGVGYQSDELIGMAYATARCSKSSRPEREPAKGWRLEGEPQNCKLHSILGHVTAPTFFWGG